MNQTNSHHLYLTQQMLNSITSIFLLLGKQLLIFVLSFCSQKKRIPIEVALMQRAAGGPESIGKNAAVSLLDWYYIDHELIIVMERPPSAVTLIKYSRKNLFYDESTAKVRRQVSDFNHILRAI